jgi:CRP-like cAMP-binding protein
MRIPFIAQLNERLRYQLCVLLQPLPAKYGDVILQQNDYGDEMYILVSGMCSIFRADEAGKQKMDMRRKSLGGLNVDAMRAAAAAADSNSDPSQVGELDQYGERVQDLYGGSFFGEEALLNDESTRETSIIGMAESNLLYLTRDSVNEKLKDQDRATFIDALKRFGDLRQRQKKNWAKRTEQLDKHIAKLQPPQELLRLRHNEFDRNPEPKELTLLDSVIQGDHKRLLPEVLEAVHARMCVRELPKGENAVVGGTNKHGLNFVLKGDLEATLVPVGKLGQGASDGSVRNLHVEHGSSDLRHTMSAPLGQTLSLRGRSKSDAHTTKISSGTCFSSSELIKTLKDPKNFKELKTYHVTSAIVRSDGATVLWLDKATWEWTRMRESQIEQGPSSFGVDDDEEEDDDGDDYRDEAARSEQTGTAMEEKPSLLVGGRGSSSNARGSKGVRFNLDDDQEKTARTPSSAAAAGSNAASSADLSKINGKLESQAEEMQGLKDRLQSIEGMMEKSLKMLTLMGGGGGGGGSMPPSLQEGDPQLSSLPHGAELGRTQSSGGGAGARSTTPPRKQVPAARLAAVVAIGGSQLPPVVEPGPLMEQDMSDSDDDSEDSTDSDHDESSSAPSSGGAGARSATPPRNPVGTYETRGSQPQPVKWEGTHVRFGDKGASSSQLEPEPEPEPEMMDVSALDGSSSDDEPPPSVPLQKRARARSTTPPRKRVGAGEARGSRLQPQPEPEPEPELEMDEDSSDEEPPQVPPGRTSSRRRGENSVESRIV